MAAGSWHFLLLSLPLVWALSSFPVHMELGKVHSNVNIACRTFAGEVTWQHRWDGREVRRIKGKTLELEDLEEPDAGEYSCWDGGRKLDSTYLLLEEDNVGEQHTKEDLHCSAQTYSCSFICRWSPKGFTIARIRYQRDGQDPSPWVYSNAHVEPEGFVFTFNLTSSPFAEETAPMILTGEAISHTHYVKRTRQFFLRDIVQPEPPQLGQCERLGEMLSVTVQAAASWAQPHSYFPLTHQIEFMYKNDGTTGLSNSTMVPQSISKMRARSRDPLVPSPWSQWSPWKNMEYRKNKKMRNGKEMVGRRDWTPEENDTVYCRNERQKEKQRRKQKRRNSAEHSRKTHEGRTG